MIDFDRVEGFQWDAGNAGKNEQKHGVSDGEAELVFFAAPLIVADERHSAQEPRLHAIGRSSGRLLHISFTLRSNGRLIRVISARPASTKERAFYEKKTETDPEIQE